jgi:hypothetical protein
MQLGPLRGVSPDSNINLQTDQVLLDSKKDKCVDIMKNSTVIHDMLNKYRHDEAMQSYNLDLGYLTQMLFSDRHFTNSKYRIRLK